MATSIIIAFGLTLKVGSQIWGIIRNNINEYYSNDNDKIPKHANLPSYKTIKIDIRHIMSGHSSGGNRGNGSKDKFPAWMDERAIERAVREAYRYGKKVYTQLETVFIRGPWGKHTIEMYVNRLTKTIESAWPKY